VGRQTADAVLEPQSLVKDVPLKWGEPRAPGDRRSWRNQFGS
jgi:hypothetical protein